MIILGYFSSGGQDEVTATDFFTGEGSPAAVHRLVAGEYDDTLPKLHY